MLEKLKILYDGSAISRKEQDRLQKEFIKELKEDLLVEDARPQEEKDQDLFNIARRMYFYSDNIEEVKKFFNSEESKKKWRLE